LSLELGVVDVSKVVGSWSVVLQGHSKERRVQLGLDGVKESSLRAGTDCINSSQWLRSKLEILTETHRC
jgi:hypothetical protein